VEHCRHNKMADFLTFIFLRFNENNQVGKNMMDKKEQKI
jgi:hypothetical protein